MPQIIKVKVNPEVLKWAREESGYKIEDIAKKINVNIDRFNDWEIYGKEIPFSKLKELAKYYKRQIAVLLLPSPPPRIKRPKDFRNLAISQKGLSNDTLLAIRRTYKYLGLSKKVLGIEYWGNRYSWINEAENIINKKKKIANQELLDWLRKKLNISIEQQIKIKSFNDAFKQWRKNIEQELGIFIFQFSLPENELDGFSYTENTPPFAIVINSKHPIGKKIFTIFHELAHIFKHQSGICLTDFAHQEQKIELECNEFAAKFLVPDKYVIPYNDISEISEYAIKYKVSKEVYLRRSFDRNLIDRNEFFNTLRMIREQKTEEKKKSYPVKPEVKSKNVRGELFYGLVLNAIYENKIDYTTASDVLDLGVNYILNE